MTASRLDHFGRLPPDHGRERERERECVSVRAKECVGERAVGRERERKRESLDLSE